MVYIGHLIILVLHSKSVYTDYFCPASHDLKKKRNRNALISLYETNIDSNTNSK